MAERMGRTPPLSGQSGSDSNVQTRRVVLAVQKTEEGKALVEAFQEKKLEVLERPDIQAAMDVASGLVTGLRP